MAGAAVIPANALSSVQPTVLGRSLLAAISQYRATLAAGSIPDAEADEANQRLFGTLGALAMRIEARPVSSLARLVDRAILAVACEDGELETERIMRLVEAVFSGWPEADSMRRTLNVLDALTPNANVPRRHDFVPLPFRSRRRSQ